MAGKRKGLLKKIDVRGAIAMAPIIFLVAVVWYVHQPLPDDYFIRRRIPRNNADAVAAELTAFDPNTATYSELRRLGLSQYVTAAVIRRQASGWPFAVKEDLATVSGITDSIFYILEPYIVIDEKFKPERRNYGYERRVGGAAAVRETIRVPFSPDTVSVAFLVRFGFSEGQARAFLNYRDRCGGLHTIEQVAKCYVIDPDFCDTLARYIIFPEATAAEPVPEAGPIEINTADSAQLRSVAGIGEKSVTAILEYRKQLGGFYDVRQLAELREVTESNFEKILPQICCDSCNISKIDINFATQRQLYEHPYIRSLNFRKLYKLRQLKGGWNGIEEMIDDKILDEKDAERLRPYLRFTPKAE
ncbi:MAG: helix-hairpin-helix domain-containing protein [Alistipes sp.]|nr:helix-hairpin-helix domain-containing protein [Alistipes sp.]